jgi:hypothetical protein
VRATVGDGVVDEGRREAAMAQRLLDEEVLD